MEIRIRPVRDDEIDDLVRLSLAAWAPVFDSFARVLGAEIYARLYPDWRAGQRATVEEVCRHREHRFVWVADLDGRAVGFVAYAVSTDDGVGEVELLAVDPGVQDRGIGTELNTFALGKMKEHGMRLAVAATGGDPGHAPARRSYEKAGYVALPLARYYKAL